MKVLWGVLAATIAAASFSAQAVGQLADIAIQDRVSGRELPVYWHEGRAYVVGKPGSEYRLVVRNRIGEDVLAVVSVDGVNAVTGETATPDQGGYIVASRDRVDVTGWRKSLGQTAAFYFTSLGDSYASRTGRPGDVGVIGVALFRRAANYYDEPQPYWDKRREGGAGDQGAPSARSLPKDAPSSSKSLPKHAQSSAPIGTGHGRRETSPAQWGEFQRATTQPEEIVAIYYDSYPNLVAQGVIPTRFGSRGPQPFPGAFVADPPRYRSW
jgi:hypothetical protein